MATYVTITQEYFLPFSTGQVFMRMGGQVHARCHYENSNLKILDVKSIAKLKIVALIMRDKSRDLFDFGAILEQSVLSIDEIVALFSKIDSKIVALDDVINFIKSKYEPKDDEAVYLSEKDRVDLNFEEIKEQVIQALKGL